MTYFKQDSIRNPKKLNRLYLATFRFGNYVYYNVKFPLLRQVLLITAKAVNFVLIEIVGHGEIPSQCRIGGGIRIPHGFNGTVIHPSVVIGENLTLFHQVTIGANEPVSNGGVPIIGRDVFIGAGAKILGPIHIGDGARIGANAVVVKDVPAGATAVGIPAKVLIKELSL